MKILCIHKNLRIGGGEREIINLAKKCNQQRIEFDIVVFENNIAFEDVKGLRIIKLTGRKKIPQILRLVYLPITLIKLFFLARNYDLIMSFEKYPAYLNLIISKTLRKKSIIYVQTPLVLSLREIYKNKFIRKLHFLLHAIILKQTDVILAVGEGVKNELMREFSLEQTKLKIYYPSIDPLLLDKLIKQSLSQQEKNIFKKNRVIVTVGALTPVKNHELLIKAFQRLLNKIKNAVLLIIGEGSQKRKLTKLVRSLNLTGRVFLLGEKTNPYNYLLKSDVFILSSKFEGFPHVLLEALYCKVPIIALDNPYGAREILAPELFQSQKIPDIYQGRYGLLINPMSSNLAGVVTKGIYQLLNNNRLYKKLAKEGQKRSEEFDSFKISHKFFQIIQTVFK
ncbi:glycosyltransferase [Candidatus Roizmanbacteria bacterium]|nr:glycosyltransferase [Candidatus Roizmanbacteria bacterium]